MPAGLWSPLAGGASPTSLESNRSACSWKGGQGRSDSLIRRDSMPMTAVRRSSATVAASPCKATPASMQRCTASVVRVNATSLERHADLALVHHLADARDAPAPRPPAPGSVRAGRAPGSWCASSASSAAWTISAWQRSHARRDEHVTVWKVQVNGGGGYRHRTGDRAQRQGLVVGQVAEHLHGGGNDLLPQSLPLPAGVGAAGAGGKAFRGGVVHRPVILASRACVAADPGDTLVHARTVVHIT